MSVGVAFFGGVAAPAAGVLDSFTTGLYAALGITKLRSTATNAIRVRRSSDNAEQDIGFSGSGLDTAALAAFVGANSAFVRTVYDQNGTNHFGQATTTKQPRIVNAGVYDGTMVFDGVDDCLQSVNLSGTPSGLVAHIKLTLRSTAARQIIMESDAGTGGTSAAAGTLIYDYDNASANSRSIIATNAGANLVIAPNASVPSAIVHSSRIDFTGSPAANQADLFISGVKSTTPAKGTSGSISTSAVLVSGTWNVGARNNGGSFPSAVNVYTVAIYQVAQVDATVTAVAGAIA